MAGTKLKLVHCLVLNALLAYLCVAGAAQSSPSARSASDLSRPVQIQPPPSGSISGKLTDLHSSPLAGVSIVLRNPSTGAAARTITGRNGAFRFASLDAGEYTLDADQPQLGHGSLEGIVVSGGVESHVQAAMNFEPSAPPLLAIAAPKSQIVSPAVAPPPPSTLAKSSSSLQQPALSEPALSHNAPATSSPTLAASIAVAPSLAPTFPQPPAAIPPLIPSASLQTPRPTLSQPPIITPVPRHTIEPDTESASIQPALALRSPRSLSLSSHLDFALALASAPASSIQNAALDNASRLGPVATASQHPDLAAASLTTTVSAAQLQALPVAGRRWQEFLLDSPAASASADSSTASFRGATPQSTTVTVDGASRQLAFGIAAGSTSGARASDSSGQTDDQQTFLSRSWTGGRGLTVSEAAIREVTTVAGNVEAEGMRSAGGRTSLRTQSGSDSLHGQGFAFDRQNTWGARNPFTKWVQNTGSAASPSFTAEPFTPPDHELVWGLGLGSRIRRDKLFWFAALDSYRRNDPGVSTAKNPAQFFTLPEPTSADVTLLSAQLGESQNQAYNDFLGVAAQGYAPAGLEQLAGLLGPAPRSASQWIGFGRIDWQLAERHRLTFEGTGADWNAPGGGTTRVSETYGNHSLGSSQASEQWLLARWEAYLTPNLLAVTQGSAGRSISYARPETPSAFEQAFLGGNYWGQLPQIVVDSRYGFTIGNPSRFGAGSYPDEKLYHAQEAVDWVRGKLLVKAGVELDHNADSTNLLRNQTGTYYYSTVASFISDALAFQKFGLAGALDPRNPHNCGSTNAKFGSQPCYSYYSQMMGPTLWHLSTNDWASFVSAQWQPAKFAVFSAGLRWELERDAAADRRSRQSRSSPHAEAALSRRRLGPAH